MRQSPEALRGGAIDLADEGSQFYLVLRGAGLRNAGSRTVTLGTMESDIAYWGEKADSPGLDEIRVRIPRELRGQGSIDIAAVADGVPSNTVQIEIKQ